MKTLILIILWVAFSSSAFGFVNSIDTGDLMRSNEYRIIAAPQAITSDGSGVNLITHLDAHFNSSGDLRVSAGLGETDFHSGVFYKWVPIPDFADQPAIGARFGGIIARDGSDNIISTRIHPFISKRLYSDPGRFNFYASLPMGVTNREGAGSVPIQLAVGSEFKPRGLKNISFGAEYGADINEAFSYFTVFGALAFDKNGGIRFE